MEKREISRIKISNEVYDIKDQYVKNALDILLGNQENQEEESNESEEEFANNG